MNQSPPAARGTRPAWGCLDSEEIRAAATGLPVESGVREHLSRCAECGRAVHDLRREVGQGASRSEMRRHGSSRVLRRTLWLVLLAGVLVAAGVLVMKRRPETPTPVTAEAVAVPAEAPPVRRPRPRPRPRPRTSPAPSPRSGPSAFDAQVGATIRRNQSSVRYCYERALKRDDSLSLRLDVNVRLRASGEVEQVTVDGPANATALTNCIRNLVRNWRFPAAPEPYGSSFPLLLQPGLAIR
jgi:hypothetical protein